VGRGADRGRGQAKDYAGQAGRPVHLCHQRAGHLRHRHGDGQGGEIPRFPTPDELWARTLPRRTSGATGSPPCRSRTRAGRIPAATTRTSRSSACWRPGRGREAHPAHPGHGHGQDLHRLPDRVEAVPQPLEPERQPSRRPRILFLADRNILADQAYNAFSAFPEDAMVRIAPEDIRKKGKVPKNGSLFFTIFQTFMSGPPKDGKPSPYFGEYPPDFFDFIVIDECHRGGANDESNWRGIMDYFVPAVQLGLTATPKRQENATPTPISASRSTSTR
jgi:type I restriction enzyme R subunit